MTVRVRFAPSPTGQMHIGNIRTAIFNWLFARHEQGKFLLRIEDTDRERSTPEAVQTVLDAMDWLGLTIDENPVYQSSRIQAHLEAADRLLSEGHAYREDKGETGQGPCIIFKMPGSDMIFHDEIKGELCKEAVNIKDFVIVRSNGKPIFHLANVIDDIEMGITHIIRGDDHIENTYRHVALFRALGAPVPRYAHLPMIVNERGKPYSKRDGAAFVGEFKENGYLADALFNYLVLLGWSPGDDREILPREEIIRLFDVRRVKSAPAKMDLDKFSWMNGEYMKALTHDQFAAGCRKVCQEHGLSLQDMDASYVTSVFRFMQNRVKRFSDIVEFGGFFLTENYRYDDAAVKKRLLKQDILKQLTALNQRFETLDPFNAETSEKALRTFAEENDTGGASRFIHAIRVAVSGTAIGPGLFDMLNILGKNRVVSRIKKTITRFAP